MGENLRVYRQLTCLSFASGGNTPGSTEGNWADIQAGRVQRLFELQVRLFAQLYSVDLQFVDRRDCQLGSFSLRPIARWMLDIPRDHHFLPSSRRQAPSPAERDV